MPKDRLKHDEDDVEQLGDIIEARGEGTSHFARDTDAFDKDLDIPEDIDVDDALNFPHHKKKKNELEGIDLMSNPRADDMDINWVDSQQEMLPSDYSIDYEDALTTNMLDEDEVAEEEIDFIGEARTDDVSGIPMVEKMPRGFQPEEPPDSDLGERPQQLVLEVEVDIDEFYSENEE